MRIAVIRLLLMSCVALTLPGVGYAQNKDYMCDPGAEDCRAKLIALIDAEEQAIDAAFWFMEDTRFSRALIRAKDRGVDVRVVTDSRGWKGGSGYVGYPGSKATVDQLYAAGIPIRHKTGSSGILHFKMMVFHGLRMLEFSGANYSGTAFVRIDYAKTAPFSNFVDEAIVFTGDEGLVKSFMKRFDDIWTDVTTGAQRFANYCPTPIPPAQAGCTTRPVARRNPGLTDADIDSEMNFVPWQNFASRSVGRYNLETTANGGGIDAIIYRITDKSHTEALIRAAKRGVPVRVITEPLEYRNKGKVWNSYNFDRLYVEGRTCAATPRDCAGTGSITVRLRKHPGLLHEKLTVLRGQQMAIVGSSNWTSSSASGQHEHNLFATRARRPWVYDWSVEHFDHKWSALTVPFAPKPPDTPVLKAPANTAQEQPTTEVTLEWYAGYWGMKYTVLVGTSPSDLQVFKADEFLGPSQSTSDWKSVALRNLNPGTTYYWQVVSSTMANLTSTSEIWSFRTAGGAPPAPNRGDVVLHAYRAPVHPGWTVVTDATAAGGRALRFANEPSNPGAGLPTRSVAANPADYFDIRFTADAGVPYRLWIRGRAHANSYNNDSVFVQFDDSVTSSGAAQWRIGTTSATAVTIEDCNTGCGLAGWGWNDNATTGVPGALGPLVYFSQTGTHRIRVQVREDGLTVDQIMLVRAPLASTPAPGHPKGDATLYPEQGVASLSGGEAAAASPSYSRIYSRTSHAGRSSRQGRAAGPAAGAPAG
jgi:phosphatidylserine/phosphatidylglycerophosphate/cardiolipin synthase-like enzyme